MVVLWVEGQLAARSSPRRRPRLDRTNCATGRWRRFFKLIVRALKSRGARPARVSCTTEHHPTVRRRRAARADNTWLVVVVWANSRRAPSLRRCPRLGRTDTAASRRLRHRNTAVTAFDSRAARPPRASPREEPADRPRSTHALSDLAWLSSRPTRDALHPTPLAETLVHRHRPRSAAAALERRDCRV